MAHPLVAAHVAIVFPHRTDVLLEQRVIATDLDVVGRALDVIVQTPKLSTLEKLVTVQGVFPRFGAVRFLVPERPGRLQRVLDQTFRVDDDSLVGVVLLGVFRLLPLFLRSISSTRQKAFSTRKKVQDIP